MTVEADALKEYVGASDEHDALITSCLAEAVELVDQYRTSHYEDDGDTQVLIAIPEVILDRAVTEVAADLFHRRNAPNGLANAQFAGANGVGAAPVRIARDPMLAAYKILGRWITPW